jgi:predicted nuclease of predicted toxin-antitoxin system
MRFLVDAQLPLQLAGWLSQSGNDARHTLDLPDGNRTSDRNIVEAAAREDRIVVTKDSDFVQSFLLTGQPRLLLISTGNISNVDLEHLLRGNFPAIERAFESHSYVELGRTALLVHQ